MLNAHYTPVEVIDGMWQMAEHLGFKGGQVLEPAGGVGHFIGLVPENLREKCQFHSVECDTISSRILAKLYPDSKHQENYFEYATHKNNSIDLIIANVPFLDNPHRDPRYTKMHLHDYFFNRGLDLLKPGAVMIAITTTASLDSYHSRASRKLLAEKADFVGAVRLPDNTFMQNAGAKVTSDILILRKKDERQFQSHDFTKIKKLEGSETEECTKGIEINEYFINQPEMMLGEMELRQGRFAGRFEQSLVASKESLSDGLKRVTQSLPKNIMDLGGVEEETYKAQIASDSVKPYSFQIDARGNLVQKVNGFMEKVEGFESKAMRRRAADFMALRDSAIKAVNAQVDPEFSEHEIDARRYELIRHFEAFEKRHGSPWNPNIQRMFRSDPEFSLILSLQENRVVIEDGKVKNVQENTGLLKGRTAWPFALPTEAESLENALHISLAYKGNIDLKYISELVVKSEQDCQNELLESAQVFLNPQSGLLVNEADYLSGNVRKKLEQAESFLEENPKLSVNIEALKKVQPEPIGIDSINFRLGSQWIDEEVLNDWSVHCLSGGLRFHYSHPEHKWKMNGNCENDPTFSTDRVSTKRLIDVTLTLRNIEVYDTVKIDGNEKRILNEKETAYALEKQAALKEHFVDYVKSHAKAYKKIEEDYNRTFNCFAAKEYSVPPIQYFPGASQIMEGRDYQKSAIKRAIHEPVLLAHAVGAGKTFEIITTVMEKKRLGIARKSMIVVQNATVAQFATFAKSLYPSAKVLAPMSKNEYAVKSRQLFLSRIASNDWDAVIIPQSFFNLIKDDPDFVRSYYEERIEEYKASLAEAEDKVTVRNMEKMIEKFEALADSYNHEKKDETLNFSQLGVDCLVLDEAHEYKKVGIATSMGALKGLDTGVSQRAQRAYMKIRYIREQSNGRNIILATGTPITNTIAELYTMLRLTNEKTLEAYAIHEFDQFAAVFTEAVTAPELSSTNKLKMVTRLSKFINQPELIQMFRSSADVITGTQLSSQKGVEKPMIIGDRPQAVVVPRGEWLSRYIDTLQEKLEAFEAMDGKERKENSHIPLTVMSRARKAAIDPRLLGYVDGMGFAPDDPESKTNTVIKELLKIVEETQDLNGTQMVFSDLFQSPDRSFNLFKDMKAKLIEAGLPEEQVAIIHDYKSDSQRERLFADMNAGRVRILFGTTDRMGVGVNAQERMKAMHHMDAPWMPMQMEQRIGRIARHGNIYAHNGGVYVQTYGVEKTMDAAIFQKILTKQKFIEAILEGKVNERVIEDSSSDMALSAQEFTALFSGNPNVMRKFELESEIKTLKIQKDSWRQQMRTNRSRLEALSVKLEAYESLYQEAEQKFKDLSALTKEVEEQERCVEINGQKLNNDNLKETLDKFAKVHLSKASVLAAGSNIDSCSMEIPDTFKINGRELKLTANVVMDWKAGNISSSSIGYELKNSHPLLVSSTVTTGFGVVTSFKQAILREPERQFKALQEQMRTCQENKKSTVEFLEKPFRREEELQAKEKELNDIILEDMNEKKQEIEMNNELSAFRTWLEDKDLFELYEECDLMAKELEDLESFAEGHSEQLSLQIVWKIEEMTREDNIVFLNEEIKLEQVNNDLQNAYQRASEALERVRGESHQKNFESTQNTTESLSNEVLVLSEAMHGYANESQQVWDSSKAQWVDEAYVPSIQDQYTDTNKADYLNSLVKKYNVRLGEAQNKVASRTMKI